MLSVRYTPRAVGDLARILEFIEARNPVAAERIGERLAVSIGLIRTNPNLGVDRPELGVRRLGGPRYRYSIFYRVAPESIEIVHIRDDRRRPLKPGQV